MKPSRPPVDFAVRTRTGRMAIGIFSAAMLIAALSHAEPVGISGRRMDVFLPGAELSVRPLQTGKDPLDLQILAVYPHGTAGFRYDLEFIGYVPGKLNLTRWLAPKDGSALRKLPPIEVDVTSSLPAGLPGSLEETSFARARSGFGYGLLFVAAGAVWMAAGFALLALWIKSGSRRIPEEIPHEASPSERLQPWIERARNGKLDAAGKAELERRVLGFWRERLALSALPPGEALQQLRKHTEAGRLLRLIEDWLHDPAARISEAEIQSALEPYAQSAEK